MRRAERGDPAEQPQPEGWLLLACLRAELEPRTVLLGVPLVALLAGVGGGVLFGPLVGLGATAGTLLVSAALIALRTARRDRALRSELPAFLESVRQHMLVGASVPQALQRAIASGGRTVASVFGPLERRVRHGAGLVETLDWAARRHGGQELASLAAAVAASVTYGGTLSDTLLNLSGQIRARLRVAEELRAASSEVRASALVLALLPVMVGAWLFATVPGYLDYFRDTEEGQRVLVVILVLYVLGLLLLRRIAQPRY
jgi:tight adherence protein B